jgi:hypothetical protein
MRPTPAFAAIHWFRNRRGSARRREALFAGRWGDFGPGLYVVGKRYVDCLALRRTTDILPPANPAPAALAFARQMLTEVMRCRPATQLARTFADAHLEPLPPDGFVLSTSGGEAWLDTRQSRFEPAESGDSPPAG